MAKVYVVVADSESAQRQLKLTLEPFKTAPSSSRACSRGSRGFMNRLPASRVAATLDIPIQRNEHNTMQKVQRNGDTGMATQGWMEQQKTWYYQKKLWKYNTTSFKVNNFHYAGQKKPLQKVKERNKQLES